MVQTCTVLGCGNTIGLVSKLRFHSFPSKNAELRKMWIEAIKRPSDWQPKSHCRVCSVHFTTKDYDGNGNLKLQAIPSIINSPKGRQLYKSDIDEAGPSSQLMDVDSTKPKVEFVITNELLLQVIKNEKDDDENGDVNNVEKSASLETEEESDVEISATRIYGNMTSIGTQTAPPKLPDPSSSQRKKLKQKAKNLRRVEARRQKKKDNCK